MSDATGSPRKPGRKAVHANPAARAAAYRVRKAEKIAAALALACQVPSSAEIDGLKKELQATHEQLQLAEQALNAEKDSGRQRDKLIATAQRAKTSMSKKQRATSSRRMEALRKYYVSGGWPRPDDAKRLRVNTKKAAGAATEIIEILKRLDFETRDAMTGDMDALTAAALLLTDYGQSLESVQKDAEYAVKTKAAMQQKSHDGLVIKTIEELFPDVTTRAADALKLAEDLVTYESTGRLWLSRERHVDKGNPNVQNDFSLREALRRNNVPLLTRLVAEAKIEMPRRGNQFQYGDEICWAGCWDDFVAWRKTTVSRSVP